MYTAYVTQLKNLRKHPNADRLQLGECFGNTVCVSLDYAPNQLGIYFPTDGQLSEEFCNENNLVRKTDENGKNIGGYMDPNKRNVTSIRLRGEKSDGLFLPLTCLSYTGIDVNQLKVGELISVVNGHDICQKYIPNRRRGQGSRAGNAVRKKKVDIAPLFMEHADTEQLAYNMDKFHAGDIVEITLKMHGTSQRTAHLPVLTGYKSKYRVINWLSKKLPEGKMRDILMKKFEFTPVYEWGYATGTRRVVLDSYDGGFYGSNAFRKQHADFFEGKLWRGETVYYEVVGYTDDGTIMGVADNKKMQDKDFVKKYGKITTFSYGCEVGESKAYVYRMTMTNEDGQVVEYPPEFMRYRCEQMGAETVPVMDCFMLDPGELEIDSRTPGEVVRDIAERYYDGEDPIGKTHVREGVVCRIVNAPKFTAYKHKNFSFKVLSGIAIAQIEASGKEIDADIASEM